MAYRDTIHKVLKADYSKFSDQEKEQVARDVIDISSLACAALVLQPIPGLEQSVFPIQVMMVLTVAHIYGQELSRKKSMDVLLDLARITGASVISRQVLTTLAKMFLPVVGGLVAAPYTFSITWAIGYATIYYMKAGGKIDENKIRKIFEEEREKSKSFYSEDRAKANRPAAEDIEKD